MKYPVNVVHQTESSVPLSHFKDYTAGYDDSVAYKGQYYDDESAYDDDSYVDPVKYEQTTVKQSKTKRPVKLIYPSQIPDDINTPIQEDQEEYVKPKDKKRVSSHEEDAHYTVEEYKPKKRRTGIVRSFRSETRTEKYEGKNRGHIGQVQEQTYSFKDNQGRDYPLYTQDKNFADVDQVAIPELLFSSVSQIFCIRADKYFALLFDWCYKNN